MLRKEAGHSGRGNDSRYPQEVGSGRVTNQIPGGRGLATRRKTKEVVEEGKLKGVPSNLINALVDEGYRLTTEIKELEKRLTEIKDTLKLQEGVLEGTEAVATISQTKEWEVSPTILNNWMKKNRKLDLFDAVLRANITNIKKYIGEYTMAEFAAQVEGGKRISFKKKEG